MTQFDLCRQDCVEGMSRLTNESVDLVVTSPPYNLGIGYRQYADRQDRQSYLKWCAKWAAQIRRILRLNGSFFLNVGSAPSNPMLPHEIVIELTSASGGFLLQNTIHWIKSITIATRRSGAHFNPLLRHGEADAKRQVRVEAEVKTHGHFKPINSKRFLNDCNTWFIPYETIQSREKERPHPATFPVQLAEWCIKLHGVNRIQTMLDPFLGIGNSAVAAQRCGVKRFIGFEIDEAYLAEAKLRIA